MKRFLRQLPIILNTYRFLLRKKRALYDWYTIPDYSVKRETILRIATKFKTNFVFIETGTYMGDTVEFVKGHFHKVFSIELSKDLAAKAKVRFANENRVSIVQGDSTFELSKILQSIKTPCVFWLDGHYSSEFWVGGEYIITAKGNNVTPVLDELRQIAEHEIQNHVILIDDARLFVGNDEYPHMKTLRSVVRSLFPSHNLFVKNDVIRILPRLK